MVAMSRTKVIFKGEVLIVYVYTLFWFMSGVFFSDETTTESELGPQEPPDNGKFDDFTQNNSYCKSRSIFQYPY